MNIRMAIVIGGVGPDRFGPAAADWLTCRAGLRKHPPGDQAAAPAVVMGVDVDVDVDVLDLAEAWLPPVPCERPSVAPPAVRDLAPWLASADAFVIVTPEHNHSFPASLKNAVDWYRDEWRAKPVAFVSYGDDGGGTAAVEQLRPVFAALDAVTVSGGLAFRHGRPPPVAAAEHLLDRLLWWARALRAARDTLPMNWRYHHVPRQP
ncbi:NAD(P)H-dependent oxidoreductase [Nonomuraea sp. NPDC023979]|uniref:NADPH-dependent FMN reductase n=1 Tax=Nonomuraea sp. NPDC023979 TaxID=3154796 RepID=UPI0033F2AB66